jgi:hypothetical protein
MEKVGRSPHPRMGESSDVAPTQGIFDSTESGHCTCEFLLMPQFAAVRGASQKCPLTPLRSALQQVAQLGELEDATNDPSSASNGQPMPGSAVWAAGREDSGNSRCVDESKIRMEPASHLGPAARQRPSPSMTSAPGIPESTDPGSNSLDRRRPLPTTTRG